METKNILDILAIISTLATAFVVVRSRVTQETIKTQKDLIDAQEKRIISLEAQLPALQKQIEVVQNIPLAEIAEAIQKISSNQAEGIKLIKEVIKLTKELQNGRNPS